MTVLIAQELARAAWPAGTQAVIAELAASDYDVRVQLSHAREQSVLVLELTSEANAPDTAAAVVVLRDGTNGVALICTPNDEQPLELSGDADSGAVGEGALALRVRELIHARDLPLPAPEPAPPPPPTPAPVAHKPPPLAAPPVREANKQVWLGAGPLFASGADTPALQLALGARFAFTPRFALEPELALTALPLRRQLDAGRLALDARELNLRLLFDALRSHAFTLTLGAGGGPLWLEQSGRASAGYRAEHHQLVVATLSLLARASVRGGPVSFSLTLLPGVWLPALRARVDANQGGEIGRVHGSALLGAGFDWR